MERSLKVCLLLALALVLVACVSKTRVDLNAAATNHDANGQIMLSHPY